MSTGSIGVSPPLKKQTSNVAGLSLSKSIYTEQKKQASNDKEDVYKDS